MNKQANNQSNKPSNKPSNNPSNNKSNKPSNIQSNNKSNKQSSGFGEKMGMQKQSNNRNPRNNNNNNNNNFHDNTEESTQRGKEWVVTSDFCKTNVRNGEIKWKEEYWNGKSGVFMYDVKNRNDDRPLGFKVPSNWRFQNVDPSSYCCKQCDQKFMFESAMITHSKRHIDQDF